MMNVKLMNKDGSETPPRPSWSADRDGIANDAIENMFNSKWCEFGECDKASIIESVIRHWYTCCDCYDLAKDFESDGWSVDSNFVDSLESVDSHLHTVIRNRVKQWGEDNDIAQPLPIGAKLDCGVIDGIYEYEPACYCVKMWEKQENPTTRRLIKWEEAVEFKCKNA